MEKEVLENYHNGYNCAQSILKAYAKENNIDEKLILKMATGLGSGMFSKETCGAVSAAIMIMGLKHTNDDPLDRNNTREVFKRIKQFEKEFKEENSSFNCFELKTRYKVDCNNIIRKTAYLLQND